MDETYINFKDCLFEVLTIFLNIRFSISIEMKGLQLFKLNKKMTCLYIYIWSTINKVP
jgi:hypothetical protein